jgi:putative transposase
MNQCLHDWLENVYHQRKHSSTDMTPFYRFARNLACIRQAPKNLREHFRKAVYRTVARDRTITLDGYLFEAPVVLIGQRFFFYTMSLSTARSRCFLISYPMGF